MIEYNIYFTDRTILGSKTQESGDDLYKTFKKCLKKNELLVLQAEDKAYFVNVAQVTHVIIKACEEVPNDSNL